MRHPELLEREASYARDLLQDIPRNHALLHARYRPMAVASGHTACPTCAEARSWRFPFIWAIAMSLARGEIPRVRFTGELAGMRETLSKINEVAQKVPGAHGVWRGVSRSAKPLPWPRIDRFASDICRRGDATWSARVATGAR